MHGVSVHVCVRIWLYRGRSQQQNRFEIVEHTPCVFVSVYGHCNAYLSAIEFYAELKKSMHTHSRSIVIWCDVMCACQCMWNTSTGVRALANVCVRAYVFQILYSSGVHFIIRILIGSTNDCKVIIRIEIFAAAAITIVAVAVVVALAVIAVVICYIFTANDFFSINSCAIAVNWTKLNFNSSQIIFRCVFRVTIDTVSIGVIHSW